MVQDVKDSIAKQEDGQYEIQIVVVNTNRSINTERPVMVW